MKRLLIAALIAAAALGLAAPASADSHENTGPPPPTGSDLNSWGSWGNSMSGGSLGRDGYSSSIGGTTLTSSGWPISRTTIAGSMGTYDATTNYNSSGEGKIEHWSSLQSPSANFDNWFDSYYGGSYRQHATVRAGSTTIVCRQHMCQVQ